MLARLSSGPIRYLKFGEHSIPQHIETNYINATALCAAGGKQFGHWRRLDGTQSMISRLSETSGVLEDDLVVQVYDKDTRRSATWIDHRLAASMASWIDPMFVVFVVEQLVRHGQCHEQQPNASPECTEWEKKLDTTKMAIEMMERVGGMEDTDKSFFRTSIRILIKKVLEPAQDKSEDTPRVDVKSIVLAAALRLGHRPLPVVKRIQESINGHLQHDKRMDRDVDHYKPINIEQVCILLRAQSFRCLICDHVMSLTLTMADDPHSFSMGRIWNHLPHCFPNVCMVCAGCNKGNNELNALKLMLDRNEIHRYSDMINNKAIRFDIIKDMNIVVEALAPTLLSSDEDHVQYVLDWVERNESFVDSQLDSAFDVLKERGFGHTKREFLDELCEERGRHCKRFKLEPLCFFLKDWLCTFHLSGIHARTPVLGAQEHGLGRHEPHDLGVGQHATVCNDGVVVAVKVSPLSEGLARVAPAGVVILGGGVRVQQCTRVRNNESLCQNAALVDA